MASRVAVVTGANKGIGYEIVRKLCAQFDGIVYLTARNEQLGLAAIAKLQQEGVKNVPKFHQLDITDTNSVTKLQGYLSEKYNGLDVLVNNAGFAYKQSATAPFHEQAVNTINVNFTGTLNVCTKLLPLIKPHGRVVNVASMVGMLNKVTSPSLRNEFLREDLSEEGLAKLMQQFVDATADDSHKSKGWPQTAYGVSKIGVNALTKVHARMYPYNKETDILINSCCPGYCVTDMTNQKGHQTAAEGAKTPVLLALIPPGQDQPHGQFYRNEKVSSWTD